jgi:hypothetical protein
MTARLLARDILGLKEIYWGRAWQVYGVIEAFALAAAGALLGVQIQSGRVRAAEAQVEKKDKEVDKARKDTEQKQVEAANAQREAVHVRATAQAAKAALGSAHFMQGANLNTVPPPVEYQAEIARRILDTL